MGFIQKDALRTTLISYIGLLLGYLNKGILFVFILSTEQIGLINLILSVGLLFAQLSNLGAINAISKFLPFFKDNKDQKRQFFLFNVLLVFGGVFIFSLISLFLKEPITRYYSSKSSLFVNYYYWIIPIGIANVFFIIFETYLRSLYKNILSVFVSEFLLRFIVTILLLLLYFNFIHFELFFILHALIYFVPTLFLLIYLIHLKEINFIKTQTRLKIASKFKKIIISFSLYSYSNTLGVLVVMTMDALMIAYFLGLNETGVYTTVIYLTSAIQVPYKALMRISNPLVPDYWKEKKINNLQLLYRKTSCISLILALYFFLLVWSNINEIFSFLPKEYLTGIWVFLFLMIGRIVDMYFGLNGWILATSKKFKYDIIFTLILLILVFSLNVWLIPIYGIVGAAISTGVAMVIYNICRMFFLYYYYQLHPFEKKQFFIAVLFFMILTLVGFSPHLTDSIIVQIIIKSILITGLFFGIILKFNLNNDVKNYFDTLYKKVFK